MHFVNLFVLFGCLDCWGLLPQRAEKREVCLILDHDISKEVQFLLSFIGSRSFPIGDEGTILRTQGYLYASGFIDRCL